MNKNTKYRLGGSGFTLLEVLIVVLILSLLSTMMIMSAHSGRRAGLANQAVSTAQQNGRVAVSIVERDVRDIASGLYTRNYRVLNGGELGQTGGGWPEVFRYRIGRDDLEGCMVPPIEVINGTDDIPPSYINPVAQTIELTNEYRVPGTDLFSTYSINENSIFSGQIDTYEGLGQEHFGVLDPVLGERMLSAWNANGGKPVLVMVIDDGGTYATLRTITDITKTGNEYMIKMTPNHPFNLPANFKAFLESLGYRFTGKGGPELLRSMVTGDFFSQVSAETYFVYRHPDASLGAQGWLVRIDLDSVASSGVSVNADDPDTIRPFVIAEQVEDFQVAMGFAMDADGNGQYDGFQWYNDESMEDFTHYIPGDDSVTDTFLQLVNDFKEFRFTLVFRTDDSTTDDPYGFTDPASSGFSTSYPDEASIAQRVGVSPQIEDHVWTRSDLLSRLWYHRAVQLERQVKIRNLDLDNTFARVAEQ
jgi:prepilin-type N-terminal cleavage/methylation domain-containing protein